MKKIVDNRVYSPFEHDLDILPSEIQGKGLFTKETLDENTYLGISHVKGDIKIFKQGLIRTPLIGHVNHSIDNNCNVVEDGDYFYLITNRFIDIGEELTTDYTESECGCQYISKLNIKKLNDNIKR